MAYTSLARESFYNNSHTPSAGSFSKKNCILHRKCFRYLHKTNTIVITILSAKHAKLNFSSTIIGRVNLFSCVIYSLADLAEEKIIWPNKQISRILVLEMKYGSFNGEEDGEHTSSGFLEISKISASQDTIFFGTEPFDRSFILLLSRVGRHLF